MSLVADLLNCQEAFMTADKPQGGIVMRSNTLALALTDASG